MMAHHHQVCITASREEEGIEECDYSYLGHDLEIAHTISAHIPLTRIIFLASFN